VDCIHIGLASILLNMSSVYSIRLPKKLKEDIERLDTIDWQNETRSFLEDRVRKERIKRQLEEARRNREHMKVTLDVAKLIRDDRELAH
jgi:predicted metal-binding transcription factor (methanogenesis marker protein 9)